MTLISYTKATDGSTIDASDINTPLDTIYNDHNGGIDSTNLADNAVTTAKITDANVTTAKIADGAVTLAKTTTSIQSSVVATSQTTASTSYVSLATAQALTVTVGSSGMVLVHLSHSGANSSADAQTKMSVALSGANTVGASDSWCTNPRITTATASMRMGTSHLFKGLTPGSTTFTAQFAVTSGTGTFYDREMIVEPK